MISVLLQDARCWEAALYLEFATHNLPPVVALRGVHVEELHADLSSAAMADHGAHSEFSGGLIVRHSEMNLHSVPGKHCFSVKILTPIGLMSAKKPGESSPGGPNSTRQSAARRGMLLRSENSLSAKELDGFPSVPQETLLVQVRQETLAVNCYRSVNRLARETGEREVPARKRLRPGLFLV
jgi:hypothetical protein